MMPISDVDTFCGVFLQMLLGKIQTRVFSVVYRQMTVHDIMGNYIICHNRFPNCHIISYIVQSTQEMCDFESLQLSN
jgi:hypothetical protein